MYPLWSNALSAKSVLGGRVALTPWGPRLFYSNDYLGSVGVYLVSLEWYWIENLPGFICLVAQILTGLRTISGVENCDITHGKSSNEETLTHWLPPEFLKRHS